jgi:hypothetical protein
MHVNELPFETCKASDDITRNVAQNIKQKIMLGEYVDLSSLLCNTLTNGGETHNFSVSRSVFNPACCIQHDYQINFSI